MDQEEELFYKIEDYLRGRMEKADKVAFEAEMAVNDALAEAVALQRFEQTSLEYLLEEDLTAKMAKWEKEPPASPTAISQVKRRSFREGILLIGVALLIGLFFLLKPYFQSSAEVPVDKAEETVPSSKEELPPTKVELDTSRAIATEEVLPAIKKQVPTPPKQRPSGLSTEALAVVLYRQKMPAHLQGSNTIRSGSTDQNEESALIRGIKLYEDSLYKEAITTFKQIDSVQQQQAFQTAGDYLAHAYFQVGDYEQAAVLFREIRDKSRITVKERAEGYLMISLLAAYSQNKSEVDQLLKKVAADEYHDFRELAKQAIARLK